MLINPVQPSPAHQVTRSVRRDNLGFSFRLGTRFIEFYCEFSTAFILSRSFFFPAFKTFLFLRRLRSGIPVVYIFPKIFDLITL
ncbi:hypothetical protein ZOSMA_16G00310 [Zostera marina]|uniref:Uncharacterized protein n=1 Tax=Zostera marina TaxID=29655 RepID=A0A0K9PUZ0_ZOSMR|nr:hypothetical protein ZOSMA_16G00310 [Zostera marina]